MYFLKKNIYFKQFFMVAVAQLVRALVCGTGGRGFKSPQPPHYSTTYFCLSTRKQVYYQEKSKALIKKDNIKINDLQKTI